MVAADGHGAIFVGLPDVGEKNLIGFCWERENSL